MNTLGVLDNINPIRRKNALGIYHYYSIYNLYLYNIFSLYLFLNLYFLWYIYIIIVIFKIYVFIIITIKYIESWSPLEIGRFEALLTMYGKKFNIIQKNVR